MMKTATEGEEDEGKEQTKDEEPQANISRETNDETE